MPRHKSDQERGYYGVWLRLGREKLGWTQKETVVRLHAQGAPVEYDYYRQVEAGPGKRFGPDIHEVLVDLFGCEPERLAEPSPATSDNTAIVMAITNQRDAIVAAIDRQTAVFLRAVETLERLSGRPASLGVLDAEPLERPPDLST